MLILNMIGAYDRFKVFKQPYPFGTLIRYLLLADNDAYSYLTVKTCAKYYRRMDFLLLIYLFDWPIQIKNRLIEWLKARLPDNVKFNLRSKLFPPRKF